MSREQTGRFGPITMQDVRLRAGEGRLNAQDVLSAVNAELSVREERAALAPTVSGGEGWEELERLAQAAQAVHDRLRPDDCEPLGWFPEKALRDAQIFEAGEREYIAAAGPQTVLALIAVARGGGALREQARSVPSQTEAGGFAQYRRSQIAELRPYVPGEALSDRVSISASDEEGGSPKAGDMIARNPANHDDQWLVAADYFAANFEPVHQSENRKLGGDFAQQNEPNTLPTVQAETAVVGFGPLVEQWKEAWVADDDDSWGDQINWKTARLVAERFDALQQLPVSTGEQPGMSEGESPIWTAERQVGAAVYERIERLMDGVIGGEVASELAYLSHLVESVEEVGDYDGPPEGEPSPFRGQDGYEAQPSALTLPDDLLSLSEAATQGEWALLPAVFSSGLWLIPTDATDDQPAVGSILKREDAAFIKEAVNFIRTLAARQNRAGETA